MRRTHLSALVALSVLLGLWTQPARAADKESDDAFLESMVTDPERVQAVKLLGWVILSQGHPKLAEKNTAELLQNHWASRPDAALTPEERQDELTKFRREWDQVAKVVRDRKLTSVSFAGIDLVLMRRSLNWYYATVTPRGPVLIQIGVQYNPDQKMTVHGVRVWTEWDDVRQASAAIQIKPGDTVLNITFNPKEKGIAKGKNNPEALLP